MIEVKKRHKKRIKAVVDELNSILREVEEYIPDANWYLANNTLHLMGGPSHDEKTQSPLQENIAYTPLADIRRAGGGDW